MCFKISVYCVIIVVSLVGNGLVACVVWRNKKMQTPTNFYIVNLAVSDLMVTCFCSWVHLVDSLSEGWVLGAFFCKVNSFSQGSYRSTASRTFLLLCFRQNCLLFVLAGVVTGGCCYWLSTWTCRLDNC